MDFDTLIRWRLGTLHKTKSKIKLDIFRKAPYTHLGLSHIIQTVTNRSKFEWGNHETGQILIGFILRK